jgi:hypothetical protein
MTYVDMKSYELFGVTKASWEDIKKHVNDWPYCFRYHLDEETVVEVESSAKKASENIARQSMDSQLHFWRSVLNNLQTVGMAGKVIEEGRYVATIVRLKDTESGAKNFRMSP